MPALPSLVRLITICSREAHHAWPSQTPGPPGHQSRIACTKYEVASRHPLNSWQPVRPAQRASCVLGCCLEFQWVACQAPAGCCGAISVKLFSFHAHHPLGLPSGAWMCLDGRPSSTPGRSFQPSSCALHGTLVEALMYSKTLSTSG